MAIFGSSSSFRWAVRADYTPQTTPRCWNSSTYVLVGWGACEQVPEGTYQAGTRRISSPHQHHNSHHIRRPGHGQNGHYTGLHPPHLRAHCGYTYLDAHAAECGQCSRYIILTLLVGLTVVNGQKISSISFAPTRICPQKQKQKQSATGAHEATGKRSQLTVAP